MALLLAAGTMASCSWVKDDLDDCPSGVRVQVLKVETATAVQGDFADEVDGARISTFDAQGHYLDTYHISGSTLKENDFVVELPIAPGQYRLIVWTGLESDDYELLGTDGTRADLSPEDLTIRLKRTAESRQDGYLHPLWYGETDVVTVASTGLTIIPVELTRLNNTVVAVLQDMSGDPIDAGTYQFEIQADNGWMDYHNRMLQDDIIHYGAYLTQTATLDASDVTTIGGESAASSLTVARAELNTLRLMADREARFVVTERATGQCILNLNLTKYLLMVREQFEGRVGKKLSNQEYLDSESHYNIIFFLTPKGAVAEGTYLLTALSINGWIVRLQDNIVL
ncbi:MAG: FimB/Mfa2 family fimbrial subunit [Prevotella sp.]|nr:FimB/Mfa2 family fimbrial subunit [Prevotella sp.]